MIGAELVGQIVKLSPALFAYGASKAGAVTCSYERDKCDRAIYLGLASFDWIEPRAELEFLAPNWGRAILPARLVIGLADRERSHG